MQTKAEVVTPRVRKPLKQRRGLRHFWLCRHPSRIAYPSAAVGAGTKLVLLPVSSTYYITTASGITDTGSLYRPFVYTAHHTTLNVSGLGIAIAIGLRSASKIGSTVPRDNASTPLEQVHPSTRCPKQTAEREVHLIDGCSVCPDLLRPFPITTGNTCPQRLTATAPTYYAFVQHNPCVANAYPFHGVELFHVYVLLLIFHTGARGPNTECTWSTLPSRPGFSGDQDNIFWQVSEFWPVLLILFRTRS